MGVGGTWRVSRSGLTSDGECWLSAGERPPEDAHGSLGRALSWVAQSFSLGVVLFVERPTMVSSPRRRLLVVSCATMASTAAWARASQSFAKNCPACPAAEAIAESEGAGVDGVARVAACL